ncbi:GNAT family N-acetyltransferase [Candidatus Kaiserbacteria bacterium]|nr:GNAT family N-acetyltransferase [Candidatus Kaiserbacteria bacterium]
MLDMSLIKLPLSICESERIGTLTSRDGEKFDVYVGLNKHYIAQLRERSLDDTDLDLQKNTSDKKRFGEGSYEDWYAKERTPFALVDSSDHLAALMWFGPKPLGRKSLRFLSTEELEKEGSQEKTEWHTIVYRAYNPFRGRGLMTPFARMVIDAYRTVYPHVKLWAGMSMDNPASIALATKLGFVMRDDLSDQKDRWCTMVDGSGRR